MVKLTHEYWEMDGFLIIVSGKTGDIYSFESLMSDEGEIYFIYQRCYLIPSHDLLIIQEDYDECVCNYEDISTFCPEENPLIREFSQYAMKRIVQGNQRGRKGFFGYNWTVPTWHYTSKYLVVLDYVDISDVVSCESGEEVIEEVWWDSLFVMIERQYGEDAFHLIDMVKELLLANQRLS